MTIAILILIVLAAVAIGALLFAIVAPMPVDEDRYKHVVPPESPKPNRK